MDNRLDIIPSPLLRRLYAFAVDFFMVYLIRFLYMSLAFKFWINKLAINFADKYKLKFGEIDLNKLSDIELQYFLSSSLFKNLILFFLIWFLFSSIYHFFLLRTKWSASIGQKIFGIKVISLYGNKLTLKQLILRPILSSVPWIILFIVFSIQMLSGLVQEVIISKFIFIAILIVVMSWYDTILFTKDRQSFHDLITKTMVIIAHPASYEKLSNPLWNVVFPSNDIYVSKIKQFISNRLNDTKKALSEYKNMFKNKKNKK